MAVLEPAAEGATLDGMAKDDPLADFGERLLAMSEPPKRGRRKKNKKRKKGDTQPEPAEPLAVAAPSGSAPGAERRLLELRFATRR